MMEIKEEKLTVEVKEEKPFTCIKVEPVDVSCDQNMTTSKCPEDRPNPKPAVKKEEECLDGFIVTLVNTLTPCSACGTVREDGCRSYQRRGRPETFCSTSCLSVFYKDPASNRCHYCLQLISECEDILQDTEGMINVFCSESCRSSFSLNTSVSEKSQALLSPDQAHSSECSMCSQRSEIKREMVLNNVMYKMCSDPCYHRFCDMHDLTLCVSCGSYCPNPVYVQLRGGSKALCNTDCLKRYKTVRSREPCAMCHSVFSVDDMVEDRSSDSLQLFCNSFCLKAYKNQAVTASGSEPVTLPVIANVVSLASALRRRLEQDKAASLKAPAIQTKVEHAGVQTEPKLMKNKCVMCAPLVHNKGVSCENETATVQLHKESPADAIVIPVPVYVPVPMHLYSQLTPAPVCLPLPVPVPILIPESKQKIVSPNSTEA